MKGKIVIVVVLLAGLILVACGTGESGSGSEGLAAAVDSINQLSQTAPVNAAPPPGFEDQSWADIMTEAEGQTVNWYMWGGSDLINSWVNEFVAVRVAEEYGITLNMVPVADASEYINKVLGEKAAGKDDDGSVDLVWVNGENFRTMRQGDLLYGPYAQFLPNSIYVNAADPSVANDFGFPVDGYESPYGKAQFVMIYDSEKLSEPPKTVADLLTWIQANPGKFTYPAPPDFTGSAFVRHVCYAAAGGYDQLLVEFDQTLFDEQLAVCWTTLNDLEPNLWREGNT
ncbi:MAG: ABC transporter substrate-binding protein, partial [Anaerolineales bacterium]|nr:ABC transporter substrate-binding protein [Anaerolineales bacterium]